MVQYPNALPTEAVQTLIQMITTKTFDRGPFALALWNIQGFAFSKTLGSGALNIVGMVPPSDEEVLESLRSLDLAPGTSGGLVSDLALKAVLTWALKKAMELL